MFYTLGTFSNNICTCTDHMPLLSSRRRDIKVKHFLSCLANQLPICNEKSNSMFHWINDTKLNTTYDYPHEGVDLYFIIY